MEIRLKALEQWSQGGASCRFEPGGDTYQTFFISVLLGLMDSVI